MKILFGREWFAPGLSWEGFAPFLPGHEILTCSRDEVEAHLAEVDIVVPFGARIGREQVQKGSFGLIQQFGVGLDTVDIPAATEAGIWVARLPAAGTGNAETVAEHAILLMLTLSRQLPQAQHCLTLGQWGQPAGQGLLGKTACIVGLGDTGTALARRLSTFGMRLIGVRKHLAHGIPTGTGIQRLYATPELEQALHDADYVISCVNYDQQSHHLFNATAFAAMKQGAFFINIARGGLVDHEALLAALEQGQLAGAGLDVFWQEPADPQHPLFQQNVIATPHIAGITDAFYQGGAQLFAANVERYVRGEPLQYLVNQPPVPRRQLPVEKQR